MPLTINVGLSKKVSKDYNSKGASINITAELGQSLLTKPEKLQAAVDGLYKQAESALERRLGGGQKQQTQPPQQQAPQQNQQPPQQAPPPPPKQQPPQQQRQPQRQSPPPQKQQQPQQQDGRRPYDWESHRPDNTVDWKLNPISKGQVRFLYGALMRANYEPETFLQELNRIEGIIGERNNYQHLEEVQVGALQRAGGNNRGKPKYQFLGWLEPGGTKPPEPRQANPNAAQQINQGLQDSFNARVDDEPQVDDDIPF